MYVVVHFDRVFNLFCGIDTKPTYSFRKQKWKCMKRNVVIQFSLNYMELVINSYIQKNFCSQTRQLLNDSDLEQQIRSKLNSLK